MKRPRWRPLATAGAIGLVALAVLAVGGFALSGDLTRPPRSGSRGRGRSSSGSRSWTRPSASTSLPMCSRSLAEPTSSSTSSTRETRTMTSAVDSGAKTRTLGPGESERLDLGTVLDDRAAWCTLPNHKVAGMTLDLQIVDRPGTKRSERAAGQPAYQIEKGEKVGRPSPHRPTIMDPPAAIQLGAIAVPKGSRAAAAANEPIRPLVQLRALADCSGLTASISSRHRPAEPRPAIRRSCAIKTHELLAPRRFAHLQIE